MSLFQSWRREWNWLRQGTACLYRSRAFEEAEGDKENGLCFCILWLQSLAGVSQSNKREHNPLTFVKEAGVCLVCPVGKNNAFCRTKLGLLGHNISVDPLGKLHPAQRHMISTCKGPSPSPLSTPIKPIKASMPHHLHALQRA